MGNLWQNSPTLEELDESQIQKRPRTELAGKPMPASGRKPSVMKALFKCGKCNHSYMSNENLKAHTKNKHAELRPIMSKIAQQMLPRPSWKDIMASKVDKISVV